MSKNSYIKFKVDKDSISTPESFNEGQKEAFDKILDFILDVGEMEGVNYLGFSGSPGCVDKDTEFLSQSGWKKISEYSEGDLVMQVSETLEGTLVEPLSYIKKPCDSFYHFKTIRGIDQMLSEDHNIAYVTSKVKTLRKMSVTDFMNKPVKKDIMVKTCYRYEGKSLGLSEDEIRLGVAIKADAYLATESTGRYVFRLKKERKIERLKALLNRMNKEFKEKYEESTEFTVITIYSSHTKSYEDWMFCSKEDAEIILDEYQYWDGVSNPLGNRLSTIEFKNKTDADCFQYFRNICGYRATVNKLVRDKEWIVGDTTYSYKDCVTYQVLSTSQTDIALVPLNKNTKEYLLPTIKPSEDGYKYCFTVPSGYLLFRRDGKVFVTGNSGKTFVLGNLYNALPADVRKRIHFTATTNKAAQELQKAVNSYSNSNLEFVDEQSDETVTSSLRVTTIFKKLDLILVGLKKHLKRKPSAMETSIKEGSILIIDESSFINEELLEFIINDTRHRVKVIFVGDKNQLCPVGLDYTPVYGKSLPVLARLEKPLPLLELTQVMRQTSPNSYIIKYTSEVKDFIEKRREDLPMIEPQGEIQHVSQKEFERLILETYNSDNTFKILAQTNSKVGKYNSLVNQHIREDKYLIEGDLATVNTRTSDYFTDESVMILDSREGTKDLLLEIGPKKRKRKKEWYDLEGRYLKVTNGIIVAEYFVPYKQYLTREIVDYDINLESEVADLRPVFSCTIHKSQGGTFDIIFLDLNSFSSQIDLTELARLLYVAISRAKNKVYITGFHSNIYYG